MKFTLTGNVEYELEYSDIDEVEIDFENSMDEINESIDITINSADYIEYVKEELEAEGIKLNDIIEAGVDPDYAFLTVDIDKELTDDEIIRIFKPILEDILMESDTSGEVRCSGEVTRDSWNYYRDEYDEETDYESWDDTISLKYGIDKCKVKKEV